MTDPMDICIWPDCTWCHEEALEAYAWKSDDFRVITLTGSEDISDETIEDMVTQGLL